MMKILVVLPRFPYPLEKGDKLRAYHQIRCLAQHNKVALFCVSHEPVIQEHIDELKPFCSSIKIVRPSKISTLINLIKAFFSLQSLQVGGYWNSHKIRSQYDNFEKIVAPDVLYCQMVRTLCWVKKSKVPKVLDFQDALSKNTERRMLKSKGLLKKVLHYEFKMLRSCEYNAFNYFDAFTIISTPDKELIPHQNNESIQVLPNGVDSDYFFPMEKESEYDLIFCGNMHYPPNVDAALFLAKRIMPLLWQKRPQTTLLLAGANPVVSLRRLTGDKITVTGWVDDIRECYAQSKIFVAPMMIGTGLQNKLLEAMAMKLPCVTSALANKALGAKEGEQILIGTTEEDYADIVLNLLLHPDKASTIARNGYEYVLSEYSWERYNQELEELLKKVTCKSL